MTRAPERDPLADHLVTPENAAFLFIGVGQMRGRTPVHGQ
jgi:hypothetical protein